ncbi:DUF4351 domain-containing protein [Sorangium sp. So ce385]|uniref:DUF4351 domain-containing protein n=1 Tax=Sorangium sp. So ce385 TaxID=3133308 RepID=UPI003F5B29F8
MKAGRSFMFSSRLHVRIDHYPRVPGCYLREEVRRDGRPEGEREGRLEGQRSMLLKLLRLRFGDLPEPIEARIRAADAGQIEGWTERVLTAPTLDDALAER